MKLSSFVRFIKSGKGITLLEVMVSMVILAFGILGLAPLIVVSMYGNSFSSEVTTANAVAQERIEQLKEVDTFASLPLQETTSGLHGKFTRVTTVDDNSTDTSIPSGVYRIKVDVSWSDQKGLSRSVNYNTYKAKK